MNLLPPILLHYYITYRCNCRCSFCNIWRTDNSEDARLKDVIQNLQDARKLGVRFVDFTGGEPLLHKDLPQMLAFARKIGYKTSVTTNCKLYPKRAKELKNKVNFLHFSLDSLVAEQHNKLRGANVFDDVMKSIDMARSLGERPDLLFTITNGNANQLSLLSEFAKRCGLMLIVNPVFSHTSTHDLDIDLLKQIERFRYRPYVYVNTAFHRLRKNGGNKIENPRCRVVSSTMVISPGNELLLPCFHFAQKRIPLDKPLAEMRKEPILREFLASQGRFEFCAGCTLNCYFDPSFLYKIDAYFFASLFAKTKYVYDKKIRRSVDVVFGKPDRRPAASIAQDILTQFSSGNESH